MDLEILKKKVDGFRSGNGQLQKLPAELLLELRTAWEHYKGPADGFRRELGMKAGTLRNLLVASKKLNHVLASAETVGLTEEGLQSGTGRPSELSISAQPLELVYDGGSKVIRFPDIGTLIEFLKRAA